MINPKDVIDSARSTLRDDLAGAKAYEDSEILSSINNAVKWIVAADVSASITTEQIPLSAGIHQKLPATGVRLVDIWHNDSGTTKSTIEGQEFSGTAPVRYIDITKYRFDLPDWGAAPQAAIVVNVLFNKDDPAHFMVYPPNDGSGKLMATFAKEQVELTKADGTEKLSMASLYFTALLNYTLYNLLARDGEDQSNTSRAEGYFAKAKESIQNILMANTATTPDTDLRV